jgi:two-component sensor histidine kinase
VAGAASQWARRTGHAVLAPHTLLGSLGWTLAAVGGPTLLRLAVDAGKNGVPFVSYFPAIVVATLFLGWRFGLLTTLLCAAAARLLFMSEMPRLVASPQGIAILTLFVLSCGFLITIGEWLRRVLAEVDAAAAREALLNDELRHRLKNLLAIVNSLSSLSHRYTDPAVAHEAFAERLSALGRAASLLGRDGEVSCALPQLAQEALRPFLSDYDIRLSGPAQEVDHDACVPAVLALHELATNAIKYGALKEPGGHVEVRWAEPQAGLVTVDWEEKDGPEVAKPQQLGMGSRILSMRSPAASFAVDYPLTGVRCKMALQAV